MVQELLEFHSSETISEVWVDARMNLRQNAVGMTACKKISEIPDSPQVFPKIGAG
ncbi:hypothetical protein G6K93_32980 [Agrobacterium rhizogenes]|uniref:hypothetical protein n=1 Tax=Rhizobium rhizogenes TaxID=359 RepID=UPI001573A842|nr:hypothetical protein [Rhizobium rhizogenes]NTF52922.1 hypothetical protein [Rhizobium rhizogenes]NTH10132.1 hypothetical protein [Rhizobium rhizogenes]NTH42684.1 hypothetical protein [Rhizobium rhizogenes]NTI06691.1 hypothetical protein [Rhizobium rhizogenes]NTI13496.1 hypothetical protein [Rhizobium rhizogenes]